MITQFPVFTKLEIGHQAEVVAITSRFEPYADFSFVNLIAWSGGETEIALLNDNLVVRLPDYFTGETTVYTLIGDNDVDDTIDKVLSLAGQLDLVPEVVVQHIQNPADYKITEERDSHDYMYDVHKLSSLPGNEPKKKRNKANRFKSDLGHKVSFATVTAIDDRVGDEIKTVFMEWVKDCNKSPIEYETERTAIETLLANKGSLHVLFTLMRIDDKLCAFSINEILPRNNAICHFEKALPLHTGLYAHLIQCVAKELERHGVEYVNWQQDLGIPGLRRAKTTYHPFGFLRKYTITATKAE